MVYEITERTMTSDGQIMLLPETEIDMYWTSLGVSDEDVIELYHNHAVCEQYHSEIKTDMPIRHSTIKRKRLRTIIDNLILIAGFGYCKQILVFQIQKL